MFEKKIDVNPVQKSNISESRRKFRSKTKETNRAKHRDQNKDEEEKKEPWVANYSKKPDSYEEFSPPSSTQSPYLQGLRLLTRQIRSGAHSANKRGRNPK